MRLEFWVTIRFSEIIRRGFTPIELIIVIVVLNILSVTVALRFIDISADARTAILTLTKAQLGNTLRLAHANF